MKYSSSHIEEHNVLLVLANTIRVTIAMGQAATLNLVTEIAAKNVLFFLTSNFILDQEPYVKP